MTYNLKLNVLKDKVQIFALKYLLRLTHCYEWDRSLMQISQCETTVLLLQLVEVELELGSFVFLKLRPRPPLRC